MFLMYFFAAAVLAVMLFSDLLRLLKGGTLNIHACLMTSLLFLVLASVYILHFARLVTVCNFHCHL